MDYEKEAEEFFENFITKGAKEPILDIELDYPPWFDEKLFNRGRLWGLKYAALLFGLALFSLQPITGVDTLSKIFISTKQSTTPKMAYRRYLLNVLHQTNWYKYDLKPNTEAWKSFEIIQRTHRRVNKICSRNNVGFINQKDLVLTQLMLIGMFCLDGFLRKVDDKEFLDANMHTWRTFGHFLGIKDEFNICAGTWEQCRPRFQIVVDRIIKPVLENPENTDYEFLVRPLIEGLRPMNWFWTYDSCLFINKWLLGCDNSQFFESDYKDGVEVKEKFSEYKKLSLYNKLYVSQFCWSVYLFQRFDTIRYIMNISSILSNVFFFTFPIVAIWKYGRKWAYVSIRKTHVD